MSGLLDELEDHRRDREVTLGTGAILGIFFGIVLICAVFFALGYSLGHHGAEPKATSSAANSKIASQPAPAGSDNPSASSATPNLTARGAGRGVSRTDPEQTPIARGKMVLRPPPPASGKATGGETMVQLMAAAQSGDAEVLATALRKRGYRAMVRAEPDHLYHVQVGPFPTRADADTMRRKLQGDGYNAILK